MGWRDRAVVVEDRPAGSWRDRAVPVEPEPPTPAPQMGVGEAMLKGVQDIPTMGFGDELGGAVQGGLQGIANIAPKGSLRWAGIENYEPSPVVAEYVRGRNENRAESKKAQKDHSGAYYGAGLLVSAPLMALTPSLTAAKGAGALARFGAAAATGAGYGALGGVGGSNADLTRGDVGGVARDAGIGAVVGAGAGVVGQGIGEGVGRIGRRATRGIQDAIDQETAAQTALAEKSIRGAQGEYRSSVQSASRDMEVLERAAKELPAGDPAGDSARAYLATPEAMALRQQVATGKLSTAPERLSEMSDKLAQLGALTENKAANVALQTGEALRKPFAKHVAPRLLTLSHRLAPAALGGLGYLLGDAGGAVVGGGLGTVMSLTHGAPGRIIKNMIEKPATKKLAWEAIQRLAGSGEIPNAAASFARTAAELEPQEASALARYLGGGAVAGVDEEEERRRNLAAR